MIGLGDKTISTVIITLIRSQEQAYTFNTERAKTKKEDPLVVGNIHKQPCKESEVCTRPGNCGKERSRNIGDLEMVWALKLDKQ